MLTPVRTPGNGSNSGTLLDTEQEAAVGRLLNSMLFSRLLAAVMIANVLAMALCNLIQVKASHLGFIYPAVLLGCLPALLLANRKRTAMKITRPMVIWMLGMWVFLSLLRLPYSLEWLPGNQAFAQWDDNARLADLISMTLSDHYPLRHPLNQQYLFSYYYAALMPLAFLKLALPILTLKDTLFLGNAWYHFLTLFSLLEVINVLLPTRRSMWTMIYLCTVFGGLDWIADAVLKGNEWIAHHEWWQDCGLLHGNAQISSFFTGLMWTCHHFAAAYSCILAWVFVYHFQFPHNRYAKPWHVGLLLISGFHSSIFGVLPLALIAVAEHRYIRKNLFIPGISLPLLSIFLVPMSVYINRYLPTTLTMPTLEIHVFEQHLANKIISFPIWLTLVVGIELIFIPYILIFLYNKFTYKEKLFFIFSLIFLISTYFIAFPLANTYSMRGMFIPGFIFFLLFAKYAPSIPIVERITHNYRCAIVGSMIVILLSFGTFLEWMWCANMSYRSMSIVSNQTVDTVLENMLRKNFKAIARDSSTKYYVRSGDDCSPATTMFPHFRCYYYNAEKLLQIPLEEMEFWEKEFLSIDPSHGMSHTVQSSN
jgi:hypothetical protein